MVYMGLIMIVAVIFMTVLCFLPSEPSNKDDSK